MQSKQMSHTTEQPVKIFTYVSRKINSLKYLRGKFSLKRHYHCIARTVPMAVWGLLTCLLGQLRNNPLKTANGLCKTRGQGAGMSQKSLVMGNLFLNMIIMAKPLSGETISIPTSMFRIDLYSQM
jgi:hypothetical protein